MTDRMDSFTSHPSPMTGFAEPRLSSQYDGRPAPVTRPDKPLPDMTGTTVFAVLINYLVARAHVYESFDTLPGLYIFSSVCDVCTLLVIVALHMLLLTGFGPAMSPIRRVDSGRVSPSQGDDANPRSPGVFDGITGGDGGVSRCLHIGNVPTTMTEVELLNVLRMHGRVETIKYVLS